MLSIRVNTKEKALRIIKKRKSGYYCPVLNQAFLWDYIIFYTPISSYDKEANIQDAERKGI